MNKSFQKTESVKYITPKKRCLQELLTTSYKYKP